MGAIVLDTSKINSYVLPSLSKTKNTMQDAYSTSVNLRNTLPSSFNYRSTVNEISNQIYNIKREISDIDTMISKKVESAKSIESKQSSRLSGISNAASKIGSVVGTVAGAKIGMATGGVVGATVGAVVGNKVGSAVGKGLVNTGAKVVNGATKVAKGIATGIKNFGKAIWDGCKVVAKGVASFVKNAVSGLAKAAKAVWQGLKWIGKQIVRTAATIVNVVVSLVEGIVSFIEAIGDIVLLVIGGVCSIFTFISDLIQGIATGEWNWSATSAVWKKWILPWVGYDWTSKAFEWQGKWFINDLAYKPFKRGETGAKIVKGVGYVVGVVIASIFTAGGAAAASSAASAAGAGASTVATAFAQGGAHAVTTLVTTGTATTLAGTAISGTVSMSVSSGLIAGSAKTAKSMQDGYNKLSDEDKQSGTALRKLGVSSVLSGAVEGTTWALTTGNLTNTMKGSSSKVISAVGKGFKDHGTTAKAIMQGTKAYATEGISVITDNDFDFKSATIDAGISASVSVLYDAKLKGSVQGGMDKFSNKLNPQGTDELGEAGLDALSKQAETNNTSAFKEICSSVVKKANQYVQSKDSSKILGKIIKDPIKEVTENIVDKVA